MTYRSVNSVSSSSEGPHYRDGGENETNAPKRRRRSRRKADRPGEIIEAAYEEFVKQGYAARRLEDIAARAGVAKGTIYLYFASKEALFVDMVTQISREHIAGLAREVEAITQTRLRVRRRQAARLSSSWRRAAS